MAALASLRISPAHAHLLLNHFPIIGFIIGVTLFMAALYSRSDHLKQAALVAFVVIALVTIPAYVTGNAAAEAMCVPIASSPDVCTDPNISLPLIHAHEGIAFLALLLIAATGGCAWLGLWQYRHLLRIADWNVVMIACLSIAALILASIAANIGGEIRHPEIRVANSVAIGTSRPAARRVGTFIRDTPWTWVTSETLHFIGLSLLIGVLLLINLRALGIIQAVPFGAIDRLLPWAMLGFGLNLVTGMLFFVAQPNFYTKNPAFYWKLAFVFGAGLATLYFFFDHGWATPPGSVVRATTRAVAALALVLWIGVMYWGSMLPFIGNSF